MNPYSNTILLFRLFVSSAFAAEAAELLEIKFYIRQLLLILAAPVVNPLTVLAGEFD